jgi:hypothetical protein
MSPQRCLNARKPFSNLSPRGFHFHNVSSIIPPTIIEALTTSRAILTSVPKGNEVASCC